MPKQSLTRFSVSTVLVQTANSENCLLVSAQCFGEERTRTTERHYPERDNLPLKISPSVVPKAQAILWIRNAKTRFRATRLPLCIFQNIQPIPCLSAR
jgi:hypothetical protein